MAVKPPAFQFYAKDWLSSSKIALMPPQYEGAYIRLLAYCWDSGDCSLPDDDDQLAMLSRLGEGWFNGGSQAVRSCFVAHPSKKGFLTNRRLLDEAEKQAAWKQKSSSGGKKSAAQRAAKKEDSKGASRVVEPPRQPNANSSSTSSSALDSVAKATSSKREPKTPKVTLDELSVDHIADWLAQKRAQGRYLQHDEHFVLDQFKNYCQSKGKKYDDYAAGYRNAFEWERCQPKHAKQPRQSTLDILGEATRQARAAREQQRTESPG